VNPPRDNIIERADWKGRRRPSPWSRPVRPPSRPRIFPPRPLHARSRHGGRPAADPWPAPKRRDRSQSGSARRATCRCPNQSLLLGRNPFLRAECWAVSALGSAFAGKAARNQALNFMRARSAPTGRRQRFQKIYPRRNPPLSENDASSSPGRLMEWGRRLHAPLVTGPRRVKENPNRYRGLSASAKAPAESAGERGLAGRTYFAPKLRRAVQETPDNRAAPELRWPPNSVRSAQAMNWRRPWTNAPGLQTRPEFSRLGAAGP